MYNNRIVVIYFLFIAIFFNVVLSARVLNNKRYNVCTAILKPKIFQKKVDLPLVKNGEFDLNLIKLKDCSILKEVKTKLKEFGVNYFLQIVDIEGKNEEEIKELIANYISSVVSHIYAENYYFCSGVVSHELLDSGELVIHCVEKSIPRENFRLFIKDDKSPLSVNLKEDEVILSTKLPSGNYKKIDNEYLTNKIFGDKKSTLRIDCKKFESLYNLGVFKDFTFAVCKQKGELYFDMFFDGYNPFIKINWSVILQSPNPFVKFELDNINFLDKMAGLKFSAHLNIIKLLDANHKFKLKLTSDTGSYAFFQNGIRDVNFSGVCLVTSKNDIFAVFKKLIEIITKDRKQKVPVQKSSSNSKDSLESFKEKGPYVVEQSLKEAIKNNFKPPNDDKNNVNKCNINDSKLEFIFCKRFQNLLYNLNPSLGVKDLSLINKFQYRMETEWFVNPLIFGASLENSLKYKAFNDKGSIDTVKDPNTTYKGILYVICKLKSGIEFVSNICLTNDKLSNEFRSVNDNNVKKCFISYNSLLIPILTKFNFVPYIGPFLDFLVPLENGKADKCDFSLGLDFKISRLRFSVPLLTISNSTYIWNKFSKGSRKFYTQ